jgi:hypothetical protein
MHINDLINGLFEGCSGLFCWINIYRLAKDKCLKGVSWIPLSFFTLWGFWNLYYYPSLHQILSFLGGLSIVFANVVWLTLFFYYKYRTKK